MKIAKGEGLRGKFATLDGCEKLLLLCEKNIQTSQEVVLFAIVSQQKWLDLIIVNNR